MSEGEAVLREVDEALARENLEKRLYRYGPLLLAVAVMIVAGVGMYQFLKVRQESSAATQGLAYDAAVRLAGEDPPAGMTALEDVAAGGGGYAALAKLSLAAIYAEGGRRTDALRTLEDIYTDADVPGRLRDYVRLRAAYQSLPDGRAVVMDRLGGLDETDDAFGPYVREVTALAALHEEDYQTALTLFRELAADTGAVPSLRYRAEEFAALSGTGRSGVNITGRVRTDDLVRIFGSRESGAAVDTAVVPHFADDPENAVTDIRG